MSHNLLFWNTPKESVQYIFNYSSKRCSQLRLVWLRHKLRVCLLLFKLHPEQLNYSIALHHHNGQTASSPQTALLQALILGQMRSKIQKLICRQFFTVDVVDNIKQSFYSKHLLYFFKKKITLIRLLSNSLLLTLPMLWVNLSL